MPDIPLNPDGSGGNETNAGTPDSDSTCTLKILDAQNLTAQQQTAVGGAVAYDLSIDGMDGDFRGGTAIVWGMKTGLLTNMATYAAREEGERMLNDPNAPRFSSVDALFIMSP